MHSLYTRWFRLLKCFYLNFFSLLKLLLKIIHKRNFRYYAVICTLLIIDFKYQLRNLLVIF